MKVLVTGGAGFIGTHLFKRLLKEGYTVEIMDLKIGKDIRNSRQVKESLKDTSIVFHLAAYASVAAIPKDIYEHNIRGTYVLLEGMRKSKTAKTIIFTSSSATYGDTPFMPTPESHPLYPPSVYGASKVAGEALIESYYHSYGISGVCLRLGNIIGPNCHGVIPDFIRLLQKNPDKLPFIGDGMQTRAYTYVDDCVNAIIQSSLLGLPHLTQFFNIASKDNLSVVGLADIITDEMKLKNVKYVLGAKRRIGEIQYSWMSIKRAEAILGWKPKYNSKEAIRKTVRDLI